MKSLRMRPWLMVALGLLGFLLGLAAWPAHAQITVTDDRGHSISFQRAPQRIVSMLPSLTETVCQLRACDRLVGIDRFSNWPESVRALPKLGGLEDAQIERIVSLKPDLVLLAVSARATARLEALGLKVLALEPRNRADARRTVMLLAQVLANPAVGQALLAQSDARVAAAAARVPAAWKGARVYFEVAATPFAASESSFIGELLQSLGLANVVPGALGPFPQLNPEFVLRAQPDLVMAAATALQEMAARPGWSQLRALQHQRQCGFASEAFDALVRPGPRLAEAAEAVADCLAALKTP